jgi:GDPmannose 4,6-dehydratase
MEFLKLQAFILLKIIEKHKIHACSGILFNHESPRRNENFVSRKITKNLSLLIKGKIKKITLGNIESKRDWGHARDYVYAMWKMLQLNKPQDFVIGTGKTHSVKDFIKLAFNQVNLDYKNYIKIDKKLFRPNDKIVLMANFNKAKKILKWKPKISFKSLVREMVEYDLNN